MNPRLKRVMAVERQIVAGYDDDIPVSFWEAAHGLRDERLRQRLGKEGCRRASEELMVFLEGLEDVEEGAASDEEFVSQFDTLAP